MCGERLILALVKYGKRGIVYVYSVRQYSSGINDLKGFTQS